jgi:cysteine synthase B
MASTIKPGFYDENLADSVVEVNTEESYAMARRLVREEGIFAGISSGANVLGALKLASTVPKDSEGKRGSEGDQGFGGNQALIVTVLGDSGTRYLQDSFWEGGDS